MTAVRATARIDRGRIRELTERESRRLDGATRGSKRMFERARSVMPLGVPSSYYAREPWPIYLERGEGAYVWDVDGRRMIDFHNGFGSMVQATRTRRSPRPFATAPPSGRTSLRRPRTSSRSRRSWRGASACRSGAFRTRARRRRWTRSASLAP